MKKVSEKAVRRFIQKRLLRLDSMSKDQMDAEVGDKLRSYATVKKSSCPQLGSTHVFPRAESLLVVTSSQVF